MGEIVVELVGGVVSIAVGFAVGSIVFVLVRAGRLALIGADRSATVADRSGARWLVRISLAPYPLKFWTSKRLLAMRLDDRRRREMSGVDAAGVSREEIAHPRKLVDATDEAASFVAIAVLLFTLVALAVVALEAILALLVALVVATIRFICGRWQCEIIGPHGLRRSVGVPSLREARRRRADIAAEIEMRFTVDIDDL